MCVQAPLEDKEIVKNHRVLSVCLVVQPKFQDVIFLFFGLAKRLFKDSKSRESTKKATCETGALGMMKILVIREGKNSMFNEKPIQQAKMTTRALTSVSSHQS